MALGSAHRRSLLLGGLLVVVVASGAPTSTQAASQSPTIAVEAADPLLSAGGPGVGVGDVGVNAGSRYVIGDPSRPTAEPGLLIRLGDHPGGTLTVTYRSDSAPRDGVHNVAFRIYDGDGEPVGTVSEEHRAETVAVSPADRAFPVVVVVEARDLDPSADLSGRLSVVLSGPRTASA